MNAKVINASKYLEVYSDNQSLGLGELIGIDILKYNSEGNDSKKEDNENVLSIFQDTNRVILSPDLERNLGTHTLSLLVGSHRTLIQPLKYTYEASLHASLGSMKIVTDISNFQHISNSFGKVTRFDIWISQEKNKEDIVKAIKRILPSGASVIESDEVGQSSVRMTNAFRVNLMLLACMSLVVGAILILSTVSFFILKRRKDYALLITIGAQPRSLFYLSISESVILGLAASLLGVVLTFLFSNLTVGIIEKAYSSIYLPVQLVKTTVSYGLLIELFILGPLICVLSSLLPSSEILRMKPVSGFSNLRCERQTLKVINRLGIFSAIILVALFSSELFFSHATFYSSIAFLAGSLLSAIMILPILTVLLLAGLKWIAALFMSALSMLALTTLSERISRTVLCITAFALALSLVVSMTTMITSFRSSVSDWVRYITKADIYISSHSSSTANVGYLDADIVEFVKADSRISEIDPAKQVFLFTSNGKMTLFGVNFQSLARTDRVMLKNKLSDEEWNTIIRDPLSVFISEACARKNGRTIGDRIAVQGSGLEKEFIIKGIFQDYASDQGVILIPEDSFDALFPGTSYSYLSLYLKNPAESGALIQDILRKSKSLREYVLSIFDQTFLITYALEAISLFVALFVLINTLTMQAFDRIHDFAIISAIGGSRATIGWIILMESLLIGVLSNFFGIILGIGVSFILVDKINPEIFGWSMRFVFPGGAILILVSLTLLVSLLSSLIPIRVALRNLNAELLRRNCGV